MRSLLLLLCLALPVAAQTRPADALRPHPDNPKYFLFRGKPTFLLTASEHYGSVLNRPFDFHKYLDDAAAHRMTLTRTFLLFREIASDKNPASPCKPAAQDYIAPWPRTGPGLAMDGQPKFDLSQWNAEYFQRLHALLDYASQRGIIVELTLLSNSYNDAVWALNALRAANNLQGVGKVEWQEYTTLKDPAIVERQLAYVRKVIQETAGYDNVYYEICNEPGGGWAGHASPAEVDAWQAVMAKAVHEEMTKFGRKHMVVGSQAFSYTPAFTQPLDMTCTSRPWEVVNVHPLPGTVLDGRTYQLGNFMSRELRMADLRDFAMHAWKQTPKPVVFDEDNAASMYRDDVGWTIHRKRAWVALLTGAHYDMIDFSIQVGHESGTAESNAKLRTWFTILGDFVRSVDFVHAAPMPTWVANAPDHVVAATFAVEGKDYVAYLADAREYGDAAAGQPIANGHLDLALPPGDYDVRFFSPTTGQYLHSQPWTGGQTAPISLPSFQNDLVVRATHH